jgi:hypothetical protein
MREEHYATLIRDYWRERGYNVSVDVRDYQVKTKGHIYQAVRSDMIGGLPRGFKSPSEVAIQAANAR